MIEEELFEKFNATAMTSSGAEQCSSLVLAHNEFSHVWMDNVLTGITKSWTLNEMFKNTKKMVKHSCVKKLGSQKFNGMEVYEFFTTGEKFDLYVSVYRT
ncbi:unnamed protein product [Calicophoron daubneyi]|uniref:Uncharacterized protein n=1 Tax=Calicophoron daubneyi TaxID=300641 RepID=A0AAV2TTN0_CALDB